MSAHSCRTAPSTSLRNENFTLTSRIFSAFTINHLFSLSSYIITAYHNSSIHSMPSQANLDELHARFEASRSFEDDDEWLPSKSSTNSSRRSTLTTAMKQPVRNLAVKTIGAAATKRKSVDLEASKKKWEPPANWEPPSYQEAAYVPGKISSNSGQQMADSTLAWMEGWAFDEYGRPLKMRPEQVVEVGSPLDVLRKGNCG